jgi:DNA-binding NarL/FixJ family response regulator
MIRVLIAEDQTLVLGALAALLKLEDDIEVVGTASNGKDALALCQQLAPDIVLTDVEMPQMTGLELASQLAERGLPCKVMILTTFARSGYLRRALASGVRGYLLKDAPADTLASARSPAAAARLRPSWRWKAGTRARTRCPTANARCCAWPAKGRPVRRSRAWCTCPRARCAITCPRRSASSMRATASRPIAWRARLAGYSSRSKV